jgi:hypothetical protein
MPGGQRKDIAEEEPGRNPAFDRFSGGLWRGRWPERHAIERPAARKLACNSNLHSFCESSGRRLFHCSEAGRLVSARPPRVRNVANRYGGCTPPAIHLCLIVNFPPSRSLALTSYAAAPRPSTRRCGERTEMVDNEEAGTWVPALRWVGRRFVTSRRQSRYLLRDSRGLGRFEAPFPVSKREWSSLGYPRLPIPRPGSTGCPDDGTPAWLRSC